MPSGPTLPLPVIKTGTASAAAPTRSSRARFILPPRLTQATSLLSTVPLLSAWNGDSLTGNIAATAALGLWGTTTLATGLHTLMSQKTALRKALWCATATLPFLGPLLYLLGGIHHVPLGPGRSFWQPRAPSPTPLEMINNNSIEALFNGEGTYPEMLKAIETAQQYIYLSSYVFEGNETGKKFIEALKDAQKRGVKVYVIVDGLIKYITFPTGHDLLQKAGIPVLQFLPRIGLKHGIPLNHRHHERFLVTEKISFFGGINIGDTYLAERQDNPSRHQDLHFKITGPFGQQLTQHFESNWSLLSDETLSPQKHVTERVQGEASIGFIRSAPDHDYKNFEKQVIETLANAKNHIKIMTAYFAPSDAVVKAMSDTIQRGVSVEIILPEDNFVPPVDWSARAYIPDLLSRGIQLYYQPSPFDHSKMLIADGAICLIGSGNFDERSFSLNFESIARVESQELAQKLACHFESVKQKSRNITEDDYHGLPIHMRFLARLSHLLAPLY